MTQKAELIAQLGAIQSELDKAGVTYEQVSTNQSISKLEAEIARLESLLPDDTDAGPDGTVAAPDTSADPASKTTQDIRRVRLHPGIHIEMMLPSGKQIFEGGQVHMFPADRAKSLVAENHGIYADD
ncbi:MAG: hypothetical protein CENE_02659 [Candidatus Celerinatantimonas neptuna]|nr:MAG: hypothetical protein CENE_02659 [Candidatus Celerinatantimonas neptuna]